MQNNSIYVGLSSLITLERRMDAIAHNVANVSTVGFRGEGTKFSSIVSDKASDDVSFATAGKSFIRTEAGPMIKIRWMLRSRAMCGCLSPRRRARSIRVTGA